MAITGIVMMAYADGFHGDSFVGVALAVGSASTSALYKVRDAGAIARHPCLRVCINFKQTWPSPICLSLSLSGVVQDVPGQRQPRRSGPLPVNHGILQSYLHLLRAAHPLFHQGGALGLSVIATLGIHVRTGRTVARWGCAQQDDLGEYSKHWHLRLCSFSNLHL